MGVRFWPKQPMDCGICYLLIWGVLGKSSSRGEISRVLCLMCCLRGQKTFQWSYTDK